MDKQRVKDLCESDDKLLWWAGAVLFAEICAMVEVGENNQYEAKTLYPLVVGKTREFERLVVQRMEELMKEKRERAPSLEHRLMDLEARVAMLEGKPCS